MVHQPSLQPSLFVVEDAPVSWQKIVTPAALEAVALDRGQIIEFIGHRRTLALGHYLMAWRMLQDESVVLVDGANIVDLHLILRLTEGFKNRRQVLNRIHVSRAFTAHQLEAVINGRLEEALKKYQSGLCFISGLLDTFYDQEVSSWEAAGILRRVAAKLRALANQGYRLVVLAPDPPIQSIKRRSLLPSITKIADRIFALAEEKGQFVLTDDTQNARHKQWLLPSFKFPLNRPSPR